MASAQHQGDAAGCADDAAAPFARMAQHFIGGHVGVVGTSAAPARFVAEKFRGEQQQYNTSHHEPGRPQQTQQRFVSRLAQQVTPGGTTDFGEQWAMEYSEAQHAVQGPSVAMHATYESAYMDAQQSRQEWANEYFDGPQLDVPNFHEDFNTAWSTVEENNPTDWASQYLKADDDEPDEESKNVAKVAATLVEQADHPKFQNSKFMAFVKKLSARELMIKDNKVLPGKGAIH